MEVRNGLILCLMIAVLSIFHSVQATHQEQESTAHILNVVNVPGEIDPQIPSIKTRRHATATTGGYPWEMRPEIFGFTEAPQGNQILFPAEFDRTSAIVLAWPRYVFDGNGRLKITELLDIVRYGLGATKVSMIMQLPTKQMVENTLRAGGLDPGKVEMITFPKEFPDGQVSSTLDTIWVRDYGPQFVYSGDPESKIDLNVIDMSYYPFPWESKSNPLGRVRDDAAPTRLASYLGLPSNRPQLIAEGGDLMTDGNGTCFVNDRLPETNANVFGSANHWKDALSQFYGCRRILLLDGLRGEATGHLDMFMTVLSPTTIFVGKYNHSQDSANAIRLDKNSDTLRASGYKVIRIPMPSPYSIVHQRVWATYTNVVRINRRLLVPVYRNPNFPAPLRDAIQEQETEALRKYQEALPGVAVIPIVADPLIPAGGSLHCIVANLPGEKIRKHLTARPPGSPL